MATQQEMVTEFQQWISSTYKKSLKQGMIDKFLNSTPKRCAELVKQVKETVIESEEKKKEKEVPPPPRRYDMVTQVGEESEESEEEEEKEKEYDNEEKDITTLLEEGKCSNLGEFLKHYLELKAELQLLKKKPTTRERGESTHGKKTHGECEYTFTKGVKKGKTCGIVCIPSSSGEKEKFCITHIECCVVAQNEGYIRPREVRKFTTDRCKHIITTGLKEGMGCKRKADEKFLGYCSLHKKKANIKVEVKAVKKIELSKETCSSSEESEDEDEEEEDDE